MAIVITLFILANDAYFVALPLDLLSKTNTIALVRETYESMTQNN